MRKIKFPRLPGPPEMVSRFVISIFFRCLARYSKTLIFFFFFFTKRRLDCTLIKCIVAIEEVTKYLVQ